MKLLLHHQNSYILRFDKGEEVIQQLKTFAQENKINAGSFQAIGAAEKVIISYYDLAQKIYLDKTFEQDLEIISLLGNIAQKDQDTVIHAHGSFSDQAYTSFAGHVKTLIVSATCELTLTVFPGTLTRKFDKQTGLNLLA